MAIRRRIPDLGTSCILRPGIRQLELEGDLVPVASLGVYEIPLSAKLDEQKFLVSPLGVPVRRFQPETKPESEGLTAAIQAVLDRA
jgi:hypothetical protein